MTLRWHALGAAFFSDDYLFLDHAARRSLLAALAAPDPLGNYFRPVSRVLWFWVMEHVTRNAAIFHAANLVLLLGVITVTYEIGRRLAGRTVGLTSAAIVAATLAADLPVLWASGCQDLLACLCAGLCLLLYMGERSWVAAGVLLVGLLGKETVVGTPIVAWLVSRREAESGRSRLRRILPLGIATAVWIAAWSATLGSRTGFRHELSLGPAGFLATAVHLLQALAGLEFGPGPRGVTVAWLVAAACVVFAFLAGGTQRLGAAPARDAREDDRIRLRRTAFAGTAWAICGAVPVIAVVANWSAYFFLFAVMGGSLAIAAGIGRWSAWARIALVLAVAYASQVSRRIESFAGAPDPWALQSHVNGFLFARATRVTGQYLRDLEEQHPRLPERTTLFFTGLPANIGLQTADGPVIRWAYRDTSLRSYYLSGFSRDRARRGPVCFFGTAQGHLVQVTGADSLRRISFSLILGDEAAIARDMLSLAAYGTPPDTVATSWLAWVRIALGDEPGARRDLERAGMTPRRAGDDALATIARKLADGDTTGAVFMAKEVARTNALDERVHGLIADLYLWTGRQSNTAVIEAYAAKSLGPRNPVSWKRWAFIQAWFGRYAPAFDSIQEYFKLGGAAVAADTEARSLEADLRRRLPGGDLAQAAQRQDPLSPETFAR